MSSPLFTVYYGEPADVYVKVAEYKAREKSLDHNQWYRVQSTKNIGYGIIHYVLDNGVEVASAVCRKRGF